MPNNYILELKNISKSFPGVIALDSVNLKLEKGTVHAIVGENGAGKSTLMKIINGLYSPDSGDIFLNGSKVSISGPLDAKKKGIAMIFQELNYFPELSIEENIFMGNYPISKIKGIIIWKKLRMQAQKILDGENLDYNLSMKMKYLSLADIQMLEIIKVLSFNSNIIIMDEPTSSLSSTETETLFNKIKDLKKKGISFLYISHKLEEVFQIADTTTVLRDGKLIATGLTSEFNSDNLIKFMVGRDIGNIYPKENIKTGEIVFEVKNLSSKYLFKNINLYLKRSEILGIAGLVGSGRTELMRALFGMEQIDKGEIILEGKQLKIKSVSDAMHNNIAMISEDRRIYGIVGCRSINENISLAKLRMTKNIFINLKKEYKRNSEISIELNIKTPSLDNLIEFLSGGNQQKVMIAKWLTINAKILLLDEPTRGIDIGAKYEIYKLITKLAKEGLSIIIVSSELPELLGMADRIYIMKKGLIISELPRDEFSQEKIMDYAIRSRNEI